MVLGRRTGPAKVREAGGNRSSGGIIMTSLRTILIAVFVFSTLSVTTAMAGSNYGCFKVTADNLNIRKRPYSSSDVIGSATKGEILEKRKFWCTLRGYWCAIRNKSGLEGYSDVAYLEKVDCP